MMKGEQVRPRVCARTDIRAARVAPHDRDFRSSIDTVAACPLVSSQRLILGVRGRPADHEQPTG